MVMRMLDLDAALADAKSNPAFALARQAALAQSARQREKALALGRWQRTVAPMAGIAAAAMVLLLADMTLNVRSMNHRSQNAPDTLAIGDTARIALDLDSEVEVRTSRWRRDVTVVAGSARFEVEPGAPFSVVAGDLVARVTGTTFTVALAPLGDAYVHLEEGSLQVSSKSHGGGMTLLTPGQSASARGAVVARVDALPVLVNPQTMTLTLSALTLSEACDEFNRRNAVLLRVDPVIADRRVSGVFDAKDPEGFARAAALVHRLHLERADDGAIELKAAQPE
jgi:transmembrane sensor